MRSVWGGESIRTMKPQNHPKSVKTEYQFECLFEVRKKGELQSLLQSAKIPMDFVVVEVE